MKRQRLTGKARLTFLKSHKSICHICGGAIQAGDAWELEHVIPLAMGGDDAPENWRPAHKKCHADKTRDDLCRIAKAKRIEISHHGAKPPAKQEIESRGFQKKARTPKEPLPPRQMFQLKPNN
jgi:5-methylcytosine-specific restriction endonuclease McrA